MVMKSILINFTAFLVALPLYSLCYPTDKAENRLSHLWMKLVPTHMKIQYAGSMGNFSIGPGWAYGKRQQWETDLYIGYLNGHGNSIIHITSTLKQTYIPFDCNVSERLSIEPLTMGLYFNKVFGENFWQKLPERYPRGYYFWAVNTRINVFLGQSFTVKASKHKRRYLISGFYEFNTNDLYVISAINNRYIKLKDIVGLSFGIKYTF